MTNLRLPPGQNQTATPKPIRQALEFQADRIEQVLRQNKIQAHVTGGTVTPRWVRFQVIPSIGQRLGPITNLADELAAAMQTDNCRVSRTGAALAVEIPRADPQPVHLLRLYDQLTDTVANLQSPSPNPQPPIPPITAVLGLAEDGAPLLVRLPSPDVAHILVAGTTGSGKTVLLQAMITSLALANTATDLRLVLVDGGRGGFAPFDGLRHLAIPPVTDNREALGAIQTLVHLMDARTDRADNPHKYPRPPSPTDPDPTNPTTGLRTTIVLFIDELADLLMLGGPAAVWALTRLVQRGRSVGIHVVAATQKPTAAVLGPLVKANFPTRFVGRVTSIEDARTATGWSGTGAERLQGQGDFIAIAEGRAIRFQVAHITEREIAHVVSRLPHQAEPLFQIQKVEPDPQPIQADPDQALANQLRALSLWPSRHDSAGTGYRRGFITCVCRDLLGHAPEGAFYHRAARIVALAEEAERG